LTPGELRYGRHEIRPGRRAREHIGVTSLTPAEIESVLALAAVAAHGTGDRTTAPLASYLAGLAAAKADNRIEALNDIRRRTAELAQLPRRAEQADC
jgi:hypothetical protein